MSTAAPALRPLEWESLSNAKGIGKVIFKPDSPDLIAGVRVQAFSVFPDDRGYFLEVFRLGEGLASGFPADSTQVSSALSYPGTIKAFHYHRQQTDLWVPVQGMLQVGLIDLRVDSPTYGARNTLYVGQLRPWQILIPPGVAHGYKVIGEHAAMLVYVTDRHYNPADEGRIPHDHTSLAYDWNYSTNEVTRYGLRRLYWFSLRPHDARIERGNENRQPGQAHLCG